MNFFMYELMKEIEERKKDVECSCELFDCQCYYNKSAGVSHNGHRANSPIDEKPRETGGGRRLTAATPSKSPKNQSAAPSPYGQAAKEKEEEKRVIFELTYDEIEMIYYALFYENMDELLTERFYIVYQELKKKRDENENKRELLQKEIPKSEGKDIKRN